MTKKLNLGDKATLVIAILTEVVCRGQAVAVARQRLVDAGFTAEAAHKIMDVDFSAMFLAVVRAG